MNQDLKANECIVLQQDPDAIIPDGYENIVNVSQLQQVKAAAKDYGQIIRDRLRSKTGLTAYLGRAGIEMTFSNKVPDLFDKLIKQIGNPYWLIRQKAPQIMDAHRTATLLEEFLFDAFPQVGEHFGLDQSHKTTINAYRRLMSKLSEEIGKIRIKEQMQQINEDIFGAYFPGEQKIEIYWIAIALFSESIDVPIEEFTKVVLTHEFAHGFTHVGSDLGHNRWDTVKFCKAEEALKEGLAQYYTATITKEMRDRANYSSDKIDAYSAYERLLDYQPAIYHTHKAWLEHDEKLICEAIRFAILEARKLDQKCTHEIFSEMVVNNLQRLS